MGKRLWDAPKKRQLSWINFVVRKYSMDKVLYRTIRSVLQHQNGIKLDDLDKETQKILILKIFCFKFYGSCSNAKYVRCGKKKGYENVEFKLGTSFDLFRDLKKYRPDLYEIGTNIIEQYIRNDFNYDDAPVLHRKSDSGHYAWDNIEIMTRKKHDESTKKERQKKKESAVV